MLCYTSGFVTPSDNLPDYNGYQLEKALNGGNASLLELRLPFKDKYYQDLGLYANVTVIDSKINNLDPQLQEDRPDVKDNPMPGTSELTYNLSLSYERGPALFVFHLIIKENSLKNLMIQSMKIDGMISQHMLI